MLDTGAMPDAVSLPPRFANAADCLWGLLCADGQIGIWSLCPDLTIGYACPLAGAMLAGCAPQRVIGARLADIVPDPVVRLARRTVDRALREPGEPQVVQALWRGTRIRCIATPSTGAGAPEVIIASRRAPASGERADEASVVEAEFVELGDLQALTRRELELLAYYAQGLSHDDVAALIHRSPKTVKRFRESLVRKLGIRDRCRLAQLASDAGLCPHHAALPRVGFTGPA